MARTTNRAWVAVAVAAGLWLAGLAVPADGVTGWRPLIGGAGASSAIPGSYIITLNADAAQHSGVAVRAAQLSNRYHGNLEHVYTLALRGFSVTMSPADARRLAADPAVASVEQDQRVGIETSQQPSPPSWGLDRIDQRALPLNNTYTYDDRAGAGVHVYILDTGIRISHHDFGGRASYGYDFVDNDPIADDCNGHGTFVAGIVGGTAYGVAKQAQLVAVRTFDCQGHSTDTSILQGLNWIIGHAIKPAVINLSIGTACYTGAAPGPCPAGAQQAIITAENNALAAGIPIVAAAGNEDQDACNNPIGSVPAAITVGATQSIGNTDSTWASSNYGRCIDIWAPGVGITSDYNRSDTDTKTADGTSAAAPHVSGAAALLMATPQFATATPSQITGQLVDVMATTSIIFPIDSAGSPNKLLYTGTKPMPGGSPLALVPNAGGQLELIGITQDGHLLHREQTTNTSTGWTAWAQATTRGWASLAAALSTNGHISMAELTSTGQIWSRRQAISNANVWINWAPVDGQLASIAIAAHPDGRLVMIGATQDGQVLIRAQDTSPDEVWQPWTKVTFTGGPFDDLRSVAAATDSSGRVLIVAIDLAGHLFFDIENTRNSDSFPSSFSPLTSTLAVSEVTIAGNLDGSLQLIATEGDGSCWARQQTSPGASTWTNWTQLPPKIVHHLSAALDQSGHIQVIAVDADGNVWQTTQTAVNALSYSGWTQIDGRLRS